MSVTATITITKEVDNDEQGKIFFAHMLFLIQHVNDSSMHQPMPSEPFQVSLSIVNTYEKGEFPS